MTAALVLGTLVLVLALLVLAVLRVIRTDGYGRCAPRSDWPLDPRLPSRPYRL